MRNTLSIFLLTAFMLGISCTSQKKSPEDQPMNITAVTIESVIDSLLKKYGEDHKFRIERGVRQVASMWRASDGSDGEFTEFCVENFIADQGQFETLFQRILTNYEILEGNLMRIKKDLMRPLHLDIGPNLPIDYLFGSYEPGAHVQDDFYKNKIAFVILLNFPTYTLEEKTRFGTEWNRKEWAYARIGDYYTSRVPADLIQKNAAVATAADVYIDEYNIYMGRLMNDDGRTLFPENLRLISHWGLRDELKSCYAEENGLEKQRMIYAVMKRIIDQSIPEVVINSNKYFWNPYSNKVYDGPNEILAQREPDRRYEHLLNNFLSNRDLDPYYPQAPDFIRRQFEVNMEIPQKDVENLFIELLSSPQVKQVAEFISERLGRPLEPFDIWYNGFKAGSRFTQEQLDQITRKKYPNVEAFQRDLTRMLMALGFSKEKSHEIASQIKVEASRGAGHAWGAMIRDDKALLRTRIGANGMDYKGYNIAIHEFGHNVEQTISLHEVDYYSLNRVPNTAFTEALAFIFQKRDLKLLGLGEDHPDKHHMDVLANFWSCYEIMGVSLVDMYVWQWMYQNPSATPSMLRDAVIRIARDVWNTYYAPVFGHKDEPILAIYSHMISNPLYLSNYPLGHLIEFQIEQYIADKNFAEEILRMYRLGSLIPQQWMKEAVGEPLSVKPMLNATTQALNALGRS